jgi:hypothetical protein
VSVLTLTAVAPACRQCDPRNKAFLQSSCIIASKPHRSEVLHESRLNLGRFFFGDRWRDCWFSTRHLQQRLVTFIPGTDGPNNLANGINNEDSVAGALYLGGTSYEGFVYADGALTPLLPFGAATAQAYNFPVNPSAAKPLSLSLPY